jgi:hypothetical protein
MGLAEDLGGLLGGCRKFDRFRVNEFRVKELEVASLVLLGCMVYGLGCMV